MIDVVSLIRRVPVLHVGQYVQWEMSEQSCDITDIRMGSDGEQSAICLCDLLLYSVTHAVCIQYGQLAAESFWLV